MQKSLLAALLALVSLVFAAPAMAGPAVSASTDYPAVRAGDVLYANVFIQQPDDSDYQGTLSLPTAGGFVLDDVVAVYNGTLTGAAGDAGVLPSTNWIGDLSVPAGTQAQVLLKLHAGPAVQGAVSPMSAAVSDGGSAAVSDVAVTPPSVSLFRSDSDQALLPTQDAQLTLTADAGTYGANSVPVTLSLPAGLTVLSRSDGGDASSTTWDTGEFPDQTAGGQGDPPGAHTLTLEVHVAADVDTDQALFPSASAVGGDPSSAYLPLAPRPTVEAIVPDDPLIVDGAAATVLLNVANPGTNALTATTQVHLPSGLQIVKATPGPGGGQFTAAPAGSKTDGDWTVTLAAPGTATLKLSVRATGVPTEAGKITPPFGGPSQALSIPVVPKAGNPILTVTADLTPRFPTEKAPVTLQLTNTSGTDWDAPKTVSLELSGGLTLRETVDQITTSPTTGLRVWTVPPQQAGKTATLVVPMEIGADASAGNASLVGSADGGDKDSLQIRVLAKPVVKIDAPAAPLVIGGGDTGVAVVTLSNNGNKPLTTRPLSVGIRIPSGLSLVGAKPSAGTYSGGVWSLTLAAGATARLELTVTATAAPDGELSVELNAYGQGRVTKAISVVAPPMPPVVVTPPPPPPPPTPTPVPPPPADVLTIALASPLRAGLGYTFRGEVQYRGVPLDGYICKKSTKLKMVIRRLVNGKPKGKPIGTYKVVVYAYQGHCVFAKGYAFKKRFKGKSYRFDFTAQVSAKLPVRGGKPRTPGPVTLSAPVIVGRTA